MKSLVVMLGDDITIQLKELFNKWPQLKNFIRSKGNRRLWYKEFKIKTGKSKLRNIVSSKPELKDIQKKILGVLSQIPMPEYVHGFVEGRSVKTNAEPHVGKRVILSLDIKDFFASTNESLVERALQKYINDKQVISYVVSICTFMGGLAQGAPTSPVLANLAFSDIDKKLDDLAKKNSGTYTRYADDLTISSDDRGIPDMIRYIRNVITDGGYTVNKKKIRYASSKACQVVTGLVVNKKIQPDKKYRYNFKAKLHNMAKSGKRPSKPEWAAINGEYNWIKQFNPAFAEKYLKKYITAIKP